jgi:predicted nucleic acid-binding protein
MANHINENDDRVLAIATHPAIYTPPSTLTEALGFVDSLLASHQLHLLAESAGYFEKLRAIAIAAKLKGPRIHDARIAALCLHHGVHELLSAGDWLDALGPILLSRP